MLALGYTDSVMETQFRFSLVARRLLQQECAFEAVEFGFIPSFARGVCMGQRFREHREPCLWLLYGSMCFGKQCQKLWSKSFCSRSTKGPQALVHLLDACLRLSLVCQQRPAAQYITKRDPVWKSLLRGEPNGGFCTFLGNTHLPAELMEHGSNAQGIIEA